MQHPVKRIRARPFGSIPRVNYDNPISDNIIGCYMPGLLRGLPVVGNTILVNGNSGAGTRSLTTDGTSFLTPAGTGNSGLTAPAPKIFTDTNTFSMVWRGVLVGNGDNFCQLVGVTYDNSDSNPYFVWAITTGTGYANTELGWNIGGAQDRTSPVVDLTPYFGRQITLAATFRLDTLANGGIGKFYVNGIELRSKGFTSTTRPSYASPRLVISNYVPGWERSANANVNIVTFWNRELSPSDVMALHQDPYCFLHFPEDEMFAALKGGAAPTGISGVLKATEGTDTASFQGTAANSGRLVAQEAADSAALQGEVVTSGVLVAQEAADAAALRGSIQEAINSGILSAVEAPDTAIIITNLSSTGRLIVAETADVALLQGTAANLGVLLATESADRPAVSGTVVNSGVLLAVEAPDSAVFAGEAVAFGTLNATERSDTAVLFVSVVNLGVLTSVELSDSAILRGGVLVDGRMVAVERIDTASFSGAIIGAGVGGTVNAIEGADTAVINGQLTDFAAGPLISIEGADLAQLSGVVFHQCLMTSVETDDVALFSALVEGDQFNDGTLHAVEAFDAMRLAGELAPFVPPGAFFTSNDKRDYGWTGGPPPPHRWSRRTR